MGQNPPVFFRAAGLSLFLFLSVFLQPCQAVTEQAESSPRIVIAVGGDVLPESTWGRATPPEALFTSMREEFARADLVFVNLEQPITGSTRQTPYKSRADVAAGRDYILRAANAEIPRHLKEAGIGLVGLANNHTMDYMTVGLRDTFRAFRAANLPFVGAGVNPVPLKKEEVDYLFKKMDAGTTRHKIDMVIGESILITDGPFKDLEGKINSVDEERGKVKVLVSMFGRETPVELDFLQVKKI